MTTFNIVCNSAAPLSERRCVGASGRAVSKAVGLAAREGVGVPNEQGITARKISMRKTNHNVQEPARAEAGTATWPLRVFTWN